MSGESENNENSDHKLEDIVRDIESGKMHMKDILEKYDLTTYKYYRILKELDIKNEVFEKRGPKGPTGKKKSYHTGPKQTKFKRMLLGDNKDNKDNVVLDIEEFKNDCLQGMKITELMEKYKLSLYQVRELRKKFDLKTK